MLETLEYLVISKGSNQAIISGTGVCMPTPTIALSCKFFSLLGIKIYH